jgi:hypothetical protein
MERESGKRTGGKLAPTHKIVGVYDRKQHVKQLTATYTEQARLRWHNGKLLVKAKPGETVRVLTTDGYTTAIRATEEAIKAAQYLFSRYRSLEKFIEDEIKVAYRNTGYVDGKEYVLKEVRGERTIASTIARYQSRGFRNVRAVPIPSDE